MKRSALHVLLALSFGVLAMLGVMIWFGGVPPAAQAQGIVVLQPNAAGDVAYVALASSNHIARVDVASKALLGTINLGTDGCEFPWRLALTPDASQLYVSCRASGNVAVLDTSTNQVSRMVSNVDGPDGIAFTRDGAFALVGSRWSSQITVIDTADYTLRTVSTPAEPRSVAVHPFMDRAYATCRDNSILIIDTTTMTITGAVRVARDPWDVAVSPDGQWVYASSRGGAGLFVIDANSHTLHNTVTGVGYLVGLEGRPRWVGRLCRRPVGRGPRL